MNKISILQCKELAKDNDAFNTGTFELHGPSGKLDCKWLDAYMGLFKIEGQDGFLRVEEFKYIDDIHCENLSF